MSGLQLKTSEKSSTVFKEKWNKIWFDLTLGSFRVNTSCSHSSPPAWSHSAAQIGAFYGETECSLSVDVSYIRKTIIRSTQMFIIFTSWEFNFEFFSSLSSAGSSKRYISQPLLIMFFFSLWCVTCMAQDINQC